MSPIAPITTGIVSVFIPHILVASISRSLYLESFSVVFHEVFLSDDTAKSMSLQVLFLWSLITISGFFIFSDRRWFMFIPLHIIIIIIIITKFSRD